MFQALSELSREMKATSPSAPPLPAKPTNSMLWGRASRKPKQAITAHIRQSPLLIGSHIMAGPWPCLSMPSTAESSHNAASMLHCSFGLALVCRDDNGQTAFHWASLLGLREVMSMLEAEFQVQAKRDADQLRQASEQAGMELDSPEEIPSLLSLQASSWNSEAFCADRHMFKQSIVCQICIEMTHFSAPDLHCPCSWNHNSPFKRCIINSRRGQVRQLHQHYFPVLVLHLFAQLGGRASPC